jgi:hypothetical protein
MDEIKVIHSFPKNALEEVRAYVSEYKKRDYINLRVFYKAEDGSMRPTQKGITLAVDLIDELVAAVEGLRGAVDET